MQTEAARDMRRSDVMEQVERQNEAQGNLGAALALLEDRLTCVLLDSEPSDGETAPGVVRSSSQLGRAIAEHADASERFTDRIHHLLHRLAV